MMRRLYEQRRIQSWKSGFTLIELLVSVGLFAIIMTLLVSSMLTMVDANRRGQAISASVNNLNLAVESMTRNIRTGFSYVCPASGNTPTNCPSGNASIRFIAANGTWTMYRFTTVSGRGVLQRQVNDDGNWVDMTSSEVNLDTTISKFFVVGAAPGESIQPKAIIIIKGTANAGDQATTFNLQTSVVQRTPDS